MISVTLYDTATGKIVKNLSVQEADLAANTPYGCSYIEGFYPANQFYISNGAPVAIPDKPHDLATWVGNAWLQPTDDELLADVTQRAKDQRSALLAKTDWTQLPDVSESVKLKYRDYRQALRDITEQPGFPFDINWPVEPTE